MKTTSTKNADNTVTLTGTVDKKTWDKAYKTALNNFARRANLKGFRNGKVPAAMIRKVYGNDAIEAAAADALSRQYLDEMLDAEDLTPIDQMVFHGHEKGEDGVTLTFTVPVAPQAKLGEWKNLGIVKDTPETADEEIDAAISELLRKSAEEELVEDEGAAEGDHLAIEFTAEVDGEADEHGTMKQTVVVGQSGMAPEVDEALKGMKTGDTKDVEAVYPAGTLDPDSEKNVVFHIAAGDLYRPVEPELSDEFAKSVAEYDNPETVDELKNRIREHLQEEKDEKAEDEYIAALLGAVREKTELSIPKSMIDAEVNQILRGMEMNLRNQGLAFDQFLAMTGMTREKLAENYEAEAETRLFNTLVLDAIADELGLEVTDEELEKEIADFAEENSVPVEQIKASINLKDFRHSMLDDKAMDALLAAQESEDASAAE